MLVGVVWGCHGVPVVSGLQACCMNWSKEQDENTSKKGWLLLCDFSVLLRILVKGRYHLVPLPKEKITSEQWPSLVIATRYHQW